MNTNKNNSMSILLTTLIFVLAGSSIRACEENEPITNSRSPSPSYSGSGIRSIIIHSPTSQKTFHSSSPVPSVSSSSAAGSSTDDGSSTDNDADDGVFEQDETDPTLQAILAHQAAHNTQPLQTSIEKLNARYPRELFMKMSAQNYPVEYTLQSFVQVMRKITSVAKDSKQSAIDPEAYILVKTYTQKPMFIKQVKCVQNSDIERYYIAKNKSLDIENSQLYYLLKDLYKVQQANKVLETLGL